MNLEKTAARVPAFMEITRKGGATIPPVINGSRIRDIGARACRENQCHFEI
jgi:hypothetical protein